MDKSNFVGANFQYRDKKGRHISAFAERFGCKMIITWFTCSKEDIFKKSFSWDIWHSHYGMTIEEIKKKKGVTLHQNTIEVDPKHARKEFSEWLKYNFYKYGQIPCLIHKLILGTEIEYYKIISSGLKKK